MPCHRRDPASQFELPSFSPGHALRLSIARKGLLMAGRPKSDEDGVFELWFAHHRAARLDVHEPKP